MSLSSSFLSHTPFRAVLFDMGSTLIYMDDSWAKSLDESGVVLYQALTELGYHLNPETFPQAFVEKLRSYYEERDTEFIEYTTLYILETLLKQTGYSNLPESDLRQALEQMYAHTEAHWHTEVDTLPMLQELRRQGYHMGIISNASDDQDVQSLIDMAGIRDFFEIILTSAAVGIRKPHPRIFQIALEFWGISPQECVMVGDTLGADILGARNAGLSSVWITRRADTPDNRDHLDTILPDRTIATLAELPPLLQHWNSQ